ncbi:MAG TPA: DUF2330 domain-containing protein [Polyangiaceae bacterium]|jgi:hypothetical protein
MRLRVLLGAVGLGIVSMAAVADDARACGGCFHGPTQSGDVITDHRMIFSVSPQQTTLYDEIEYQGNPASFAWVLPIHGQVQVGLSSDIVFASLDSATQTTIESPSLPPCNSCSCGEFGGPSANGGSSSGSSSGGGTTGVTVISQSVVGPYDTVQLQSTNPTALTDWLTANQFVIPADVQPIIAAYVNEGFDFLVLKLQPGQGVQAMRPVSVTTPGAGLSLPLRMVSAGTGATVGITLWVVAQGRYEAASFPNFTIDPTTLVWDWNAQTSNYTTLVQAKESAASFATWQTESSLDISPYQVENTVLNDDASDDYLAVPGGDGGEGGAGETAEEVRAADLATLFPGDNQGTFRITRMRADLAHAALATDLTLQASADQSDVSNFYQVTQSVNAPACPPVPDPCPPCGGASSSGGDAGVVGSLNGGSSTSAASPGQQSFGCSAVGSDRGGLWLELTLAGILGLSVMRGRKKRK